MASSMHLLVLGGTMFLGRHVVMAALAAGHRVTVFNRGRRIVAWPAPVEALAGDRDADASALRGRSFDAVIDCSAYRPSHVELVATSLGMPLPYWIFISSISVVARFPPGRPHDETAAVTDEVTGYGGGKARAEEALQALCGGQAAIVRPGLIVGRHDPTGRFSYWPWRLDRGGTVLAPGRPERLVQVIDARDLASFCLGLAESREAGTFNAVSEPVTMEALLTTCRDVARSDAAVAWRSDAELLEAGVKPWSGLPLWIPEGDPDFGGMLLARNDRASAAGLRTRSLAETVADVLDELRQDASRASFPNVISPEVESRLLART